MASTKYCQPQTKPGPEYYDTKMAPLRLPMPLVVSLQGELFQYARGGRVAFESSPIVVVPPVEPSSRVVTSTAAAANPTQKKCILLGGLSDGLLPVPYTVALQQACGEEDWSLVQPILSSSYTGFGHGSLDRDVQELDELLDYLIQFRGCERVALVGHSTGCQDIVHYLKHGKLQDRVVLAVLQAPVSDRESASLCFGCHDSDDEHLRQKQTDLATAIALRDSNRIDEMMPRAAFWSPVTARRYLDLSERDGTDDYFSSDYTDVELRARLAHVSAHSSLKHCLVTCSGADEYVPKSIEGEHLMHRLCRAMNGGGASDDGNDGTIRTTAIPLFLPRANHNLSSNLGEDAGTFVSAVKNLLHQC